MSQWVSRTGRGDRRELEILPFYTGQKVNDDDKQIMQNPSGLLNQIKSQLSVPGEMRKEASHRPG